MAEFSSLVSIFFDPDSGEPSGLQALVEGDTIASSVLDPGSRDALTRVVDSSAGWEQGLDTDTYNNLVTTSGRAEEMVTFSANIQSSATYLSSVLDASVGSGIVDVCAYIAAEEGTWNSGGLPSAVGFENWNNTYNNVLGTSGDRDRVITYVTDGSANIYDVSTNFSTFSGNIEASTRGLSSVLDASVGSGLVDVCAYIVAEEAAWSTGGTGPSADGFENWDNTYDNVSNASGDRDNVTTYVTGASGEIDNVRTRVTTVSADVDNVRTYVTDASAEIDNVRTRVTSVSADVDNTRTYVTDASAEIDNVRTRVTTTSADVDNVRTYVTDGSANIFDVSTNFSTFSGNVETSVVTLDGSVGELNTFSGSVETSTATLDSRVDTIEPLVPSAAGFNNWNTIYGDRDNIRSVSGSVAASDTAFLNGATPTLANDLDGGSNDILGVNKIRSDTLQTRLDTGTLGVSGPNLTLYGENVIRIGQLNNNFVTTDFKASADNWNSVYDTTYNNSGGAGPWNSGGGGTKEIETPHIQGGVIWASGTGATSGYGNTNAGVADQVLFSNGTASPYFAYIRTSQVKNYAGLPPPVGSIIVGNGTSYVEGDHGDLSGLGDDDHTQYIITDPTTSGRNIITPSGDFPGLIISATSTNTGSLFTIKDESDDDLFEVTHDGNVEISRGSIYGVRHPDDTTFYPLVGRDSANRAIFGNMATGGGASNTGTRVRLSDTGDLNFESNNNNVIFKNGSLNTEVLRVNSDGSLQPIGDDLLVSGGGSFTGDVTANSQSVSGHIASGSVHFTEASIDHGSIAGLGDNDHPQYVLSSTNNTLSSLVTSVETSTVDLSSYIAANETTWSTDNDTTDHTALSNIGTNTHAQIDAHITGVTAASGNWEGTYDTVLNNSGTWGGGGGGASAEGFENWNSTYDSVLNTSANWNTAYTSATNTTDVSSIFSGNINVIGTTPAHSGTIGTTNAATFGLETTGNCSIIAPSLILSATSAYQFRKNGSTTYTDTDFPQSCRDWDSTYNTVLNNSGTWGGGGGGGGGVAAGITIVNTGTDNINSTGGALVPLDTSTGFPAYGTYGTDYSYTAGNSYVTINTAGTYEVTFNVAYTTVTARWNGILKIYKGTGGASPSAWIGYGAGKMGYVRNSTGHNEASLIVTCLVTCSANDTIGGHVINEAANGTCTLVANETFMTIKRMS